MLPARMKSSGKRPAGAGFTLVELMIVVAIVAILAAIAYPSYIESVRKSKRNEAKAVLVELAQKAERFHTVNNTYTGFFTALQTAADPLLTTARDYTVATSGTPDDQTFALTATPNATSAQAADKCGVLSVTHTGARSAKKGVTSVPGCW